MEKGIDLKLRMLYLHSIRMFCAKFQLIWINFQLLSGGHLGFFAKGYAFDFGSKFQISSKFVYGQNGRGNDVW